MFCPCRFGDADGGNWCWFEGDWETGWTGPMAESREPNCGSRPSRSICWDFVDDGGDCEGEGWTWAGEGGSAEGGALVVRGAAVFVGIEDVEGYWRRAVEAALRATFDDEEPILGECCVWCFGEAIESIKRARESGHGDFMSSAKL
jgi:hypothetical protein